MPSEPSQGNEKEGITTIVINNINKTPKKILCIIKVCWEGTPGGVDGASSSSALNSGFEPRSYSTKCLPILSFSSP